MGATSNESCK